MPALIPVFEPVAWQMTAGERCAFEGVLAQLKPKLAIELGTAEGGSLARIALHAEKVHSFDLVTPQLDLSELPHVEIHTGDGHELLPRELTRISEAGQTVDFAFVDGDHTPEGVKRDIEDLLRSPAVSRTIILVHDTANEYVRAGIDAVDYGAFSKVRFVDMDFIPGYLVRIEPFHHEMWGGLGLIIVDAGDDAFSPLHSYSEVGYRAQDALISHRDRIVAGPVDDQPAPADDGQAAAELEALRARNAVLEHEKAVIARSLSWRVTWPLRFAAAQLRARAAAR